MREENFLDRPRLSCRVGDRIAARLALRQADARIGPYALAPEDATEDWPVVVGTITHVMPRSGLALLKEHGAYCFLAGARKIQ